MGIGEGPVRNGHRLQQAGALVFFLALFVGLAIPKFAVPRVALSAHLLGIMQGLFLMVVGLLWPKLKLAPAVSRFGSWLAIYGCFAAWTANVLAGAWGAGNALLPMAAGQARGSALQEAVIATGLRTGAVSLIVSVALVLWGLRGLPAGGSAD